MRCGSTARDVRAKVIGEGANLGVTQAGRIEFALERRADQHRLHRQLGRGRLLGQRGQHQDRARRGQARGQADRAQADQAARSDDRRGRRAGARGQPPAGARAVDRRGRRRAARSPRRLRLIETLEERGALDRRTEGLADGEALARRAADGRGPDPARAGGAAVDRPSWCCRTRSRQSSLPDDPALEPLLLERFPAADAQDRSGGRSLGHRLRRADRRDRARQPDRQPHGPRPSVRAGRGRRRRPRPGRRGVRRGRASCSALDALWARARNAPRCPKTRGCCCSTQPRWRCAARWPTCCARARSCALPRELIAELGTGVRAAVGSRRRAAGRRGARAVGRGCVAEFVAAGRAREARGQGRPSVRHRRRDRPRRARRATPGSTPRDADRRPSPISAQRLGLDWAQSTAAMMNPSDPWERLLVAGLARDFQQMRFEFLRRLSRRKGAQGRPGGGDRRAGRTSTRRRSASSAR